jgi:predicted AAA+ superfamily ATPase
VVRGARQVGKSWILQELGRREFDSIAVCNFERDPDLGDLFAGEPRASLAWLEARLRIRISPGKTLLFLDEIQAAPQVLSRLRYFAEEIPSLHVVAAGSLLDFALAAPEHSMPVGRVSFGYLEPMTFVEFLTATGEDRLAEVVRTVTPARPPPQPLHHRLLALTRTYALVGGMPAAVATWIETGSAVEVNRVQRELLTSLRADFAKYRTRANVGRIGKVFDALPRLVGRKFMPVQVDREEKAHGLKEAFRLLCLARVATPVERSACNGVPLAAEVDARYSRVCVLDVGLLGALSGLDGSVLARSTDLLQVHEGQLAEQLVGQALRAARSFDSDPRLFCWVREARTSNAEVDFVIQSGERPVPIEVKAGATGRLRSLHVMIREKGLRLGVRVGSEPLQRSRVDTALPDGKGVSFELLSVPLYLASEIPRLVTEANAPPRRIRSLRRRG